MTEKENGESKNSSHNFLAKPPSEIRLGGSDADRSKILGRMDSAIQLV